MSHLPVEDEKTLGFQESPAGSLKTDVIDEEKEALEGYVLDPSLYPRFGSGLKLTSDNKRVLIPQPQDTELDPLNWPQSKKNLFLFIIGWLAFSPDWASGFGNVIFIPQSMEWSISQVEVQKNIVGNVFCIGVSGLFGVSMSAYFGRLPVLFLMNTLAILSGAWCGAATTWHSFLWARISNGLANGVDQAVVLMWIQDLFFFHEHARKINIVEAGIVMSPYFGPFLEGFIANGTSWRWGFWMYLIYMGIGWLMIVFLLDEPMYSRQTPASQQPPRRSRIKRLFGIEQWQSRHLRPGFIPSITRIGVAITKLPVVLVVIYFFLNFAWAIGFNVTVSIWLAEFYGFDLVDLSLFYLSPLIGILLGLALGHPLHDRIGRWFATRHAGHQDAEARILINYLATLLLTVSLLVLGFALQHQWHWAVLAVFGALQVVGMMLLTVACNAYLLDAYPEGSGEVCAWLCFARTMGGFMASYVEVEWVQRLGAARTFGIQAAITVAAGAVVVVLQVYGKAIRKRQGRMVFGR